MSVTSKRAFEKKLHFVVFGRREERFLKIQSASLDRPKFLIYCLVFLRITCPFMSKCKIFQNMADRKILDTPYFGPNYLDTWFAFLRFDRSTKKLKNRHFLISVTRMKANNTKIRILLQAFHFAAQGSASPPGSGYFILILHI